MIRFEIKTKLLIIINYILNKLKLHSLKTIQSINKMVLTSIVCMIKILLLM